MTSNNPAGTQQSHSYQTSTLGSNHSDRVWIRPISISKWIILAAAFAVMFVGIGLTNTFGVFQEYYQTVLFPHKAPAELILVGSVAASLYMVLGVFTGRFADVCGYQVSLGIGSAMMVSSLFVASISKQFYQIFVSQGLMFGLGLSFAYYPAITISRECFGASRHGLVNGIVVSGGAFGGGILPYIVRLLLTSRGLAQIFRILGYVSAGLLFPTVLLLRPTARPVRRGEKLLDLSLLRDRRFAVMLGTGTIAMTGFLPRYFLVTSSAIYKGVPPTYAACLLGLMNGLSIIGRVGIGMFADRYGKLLALESSFLFCGLGHILFWLPGVLIQQPESSTAFFTLFVVYTGLFGSGFVSLIPVVVAHHFGTTALASKVGLLNSIMGLGVFGGPSVIYAIVSEGKQDWTMGILTAGLFMVVGGVTMAGAFEWAKRFELRHEENRQMSLNSVH